MANLKWKTPRSKTRSRRAANWKLGDVTTVECPQCHQPKRPHFACENAERMTAARSSKFETSTPDTTAAEMSLRGVKIVGVGHYAPAARRDQRRPREVARHDG